MSTYQQGWQAQGACVNLNTNEADKAFFTGKGRPARIPPWEQYCGDCPVRVSCLKYAIVNDLVGVWGNTTKSQRDQIPLQLKQEYIQEAMELGYLLPSVSRLVDSLTKEYSQVPVLQEDELLAEFRFEFEIQESLQKTRKTLSSSLEQLAV